MDEFNKEVCKLYKNIDEQIEYLKMFKKIIINENERSILEDRNYISVINPYKEFFATNQIVKNIEGYTKKIHIYESETPIQNILSVVNMMIKFLTIFLEPLGNLKGNLKMY